MSLWDAFVDLLAALLVGVAGVFGGNMGLAIGFVSLAARLAVLPLTLRLACRSLELRAAMARLEPQLTKIRARYKSDPQRLAVETAELYRRHNVKVVDGRGLVGTLVQAPVFIALFSAVRRGMVGAKRFLWITDLAKPDLLMASACGIVTGLAVALGPAIPSSQRPAAVLVPAVLTAVFLWRVAAGVAIYALASGLVGVVQSLLVRRYAARLPA